MAIFRVQKIKVHAMIINRVISVNVNVKNALMNWRFTHDFLLLTGFANFKISILILP